MNRGRLSVSAGGRVTKKCVKTKKRKRKKTFHVREEKECHRRRTGSCFAHRAARLVVPKNGTKQRQNSCPNSSRGTVVLDAVKQNSLPFKDLPDACTDLAARCRSKP